MHPPSSASPTSTSSSTSPPLPLPLCRQQSTAPSSPSPPLSSWYYQFCDQKSQTIRARIERLQAVKPGTLLAPTPHGTSMRTPENTQENTAKQGYSDSRTSQETTKTLQNTGTPCLQNQNWQRTPQRKGQVLEQQQRMKHTRPLDKGRNFKISKLVGCRSKNDGALALLCRWG